MADQPEPNDRSRSPFGTGPGMNASPTGRFGGPVPQNGPLRTALAVRGFFLALLALVVVVLVVVF